MRKTTTKSAFPDQLYVVREEDDNSQFFIASEGIEDIEAYTVVAVYERVIDGDGIVKVVRTIER